MAKAVKKVVRKKVKRTRRSLSQTVEDMDSAPEPDASDTEQAAKADQASGEKDLFSDTEPADQAQKKAQKASASVALEEPPSDAAPEAPGDDADHGSSLDADTHAKYEEVKKGELHITDLQKMTVEALHALAKEEA